MFFGTVYKCDLHSITPHIKVNRDWSKKENIEDADTIVVAKIMVQKTFLPNIYKEIITGRLIHVYKTIRYSYGWDGEVIEVPAKTVFIKIYENRLCAYNDLNIAKSYEIEKYIEKNSTNVDEYRKKLDDLITQADEYYDNSYEQENYSCEKEKVKSLLKKVKRLKK